MPQHAVGAPRGAEHLALPAPKRKIQVLDRETRSLLNLADAAKAWHLDPSRDGGAAALHAACAEWMLNVSGGYDSQRTRAVIENERDNTLNDVLRGLYSENDSTQLRAIIASVEAMRSRKATQGT